MAAKDDFRTKLRNVLVGRSTHGMGASHASHKSKHAQHLTDCDTHWAAMSQGEKDPWIATFNALSVDGVKSRITLADGTGFPKKISISPSMMTDLKARYT